MLRSAMIACSILLVALMVSDADAGRRGCRGGRCSTGGCRGGVCPTAQANATDQTGDAAVQVAEEPTTEDAVAATEAEADTTVAQSNRRYRRIRSRSRRR